MFSQISKSVIDDAKRLMDYIDYKTLRVTGGFDHAQWPLVTAHLGGKEIYLGSMKPIDFSDEDHPVDKEAFIKLVKELDIEITKMMSYREESPVSTRGVGPVFL